MVCLPSGRSVVCERGWHGREVDDPDHLLVPCGMGLPFALAWRPRWRHPGDGCPRRARVVSIFTRPVGRQLTYETRSLERARWTRPPIPRLLYADHPTESIVRWADYSISTLDAVTDGIPLPWTHGTSWPHTRRNKRNTMNARRPPPTRMKHETPSRTSGYAPPPDPIHSPSIC